MKATFSTLLIAAAVLFCIPSSYAQKVQEWRVYSFNAGGSTGKMDKLMTDILLPAYKAMDIKVGCYRDYGLSQPATYYFLFEYPSYEGYLKANETLLKNEAYVAAMKEDAAAPRPIFFRYDSYLCQPFTKWPDMTPADGKTIIEWRKYDSANLEAHMRKVNMFNGGEIDIFLDCGMKPLSFAHVVAGKDLPTLIYVMQFDDMDDSVALWRKFNTHPSWTAMRAAPEWANATNQINRVFLTPLSYNPKY